MTSADPAPARALLLRERLRAGYRRSGLHRGVGLSAVLSAAVTAHPAGRLTFCTDRPAEISLGDFMTRATHLAGVLRRDGLASGEAVAIQLPNSRAAWLAYLACWLAGAVVVPIPPTYGTQEAGFILEDSGATRYVMADRWRGTDYVAGLASIRRVGRLRSITVVGDNVPEDCTSFAGLERDAAGAIPLEPDSGQRGTDTCLICYTSGSTAVPKGAVHSHDTLVAELAQTGLVAPGRPVTLTARPLGTIAGVLGMLRAIVLGGDTYILDRWDAIAALEIVTDRRVSQLQTVPLMLATLLDEAQRQERRLEHLAQVTVGATHVPPALIGRAESAGVHAYRLYGSTEHPTVAAGRAGDPLVVRQQTDGRPLPGAEVRIVDDEGRDRRSGEEGEVLTRGPDQFIGYTDHAATLAALTGDGWLKTGDIGYRTPEGQLVVTDRKKEIIIRAGVNLSPAAIEDVLTRHAAVAECAVVGAPDPLYGQRPVAFVVLHSGAALTLPEVRRHFAEIGVARQKTPERLVIKSVLPRTSGGKVAKAVLRQELA